MNAPLLILPALLGTLVLSAAKTLPTDLRHDATGKAPLTVARMASVRGAGSVCETGCNEPNVSCHWTGGSPYPYPENEPGNISTWQSQMWYPHFECHFAWTTSTCTAGQDSLCNIVYTYIAHGPCASDPATDYTTSSTCVLSSTPRG